MENSMAVPKRKEKETELPYKPAIPLRSIYSKELKAETQEDICTFVFLAALFTIAERWKHPSVKGPLTDEWINKR